MQASPHTELARQGNPDVRVILYTIWPSKEYTLLPGDTDWYPEGIEFGRTEKWTEEAAADLRERFPGIDAAVAPTSLVIRFIGGMANAGLIPNLQGYDDLTQDAGHMGLYGGYAIGCTFTAMLYQESPIGYPSTMLKMGRDGFTDEVNLEVDAEAAHAIHEVIWDVLSLYQHDGLDTGLWLSAGRLPAALVGKAYDRPIPVVGAEGPVQFSIKNGELPVGLSLHNGRITGTASASATAWCRVIDPSVCCAARRKKNQTAAGP